MSGSRGSGSGNGDGAQLIPAGSRKMVHSLKEIVNCSEAEIYATLKECNMDPNEAVNRLLSQDPFHEVKSKREKKKRGKDNIGSRSRGAHSYSSRGGKIGGDRYLGRGGSALYNSSDSSHLPGKSLQKKENGSTPYASYLSSMPGMSGDVKSRGPAASSDGASAEYKGSLVGRNDAMPSGVQPSPAWGSVPGQVSMAEMERPHNPSSSNHILHNSLRYTGDHAIKDSDLGTSSSQNVPVEEWPSMEKPATAKVISMSEYMLDREQHADVPSNHVFRHSESEDVEEEEEYIIEHPGVTAVGSDSISGRNIPDDGLRDTSLFENDLYENMGSYQHQPHVSHEVDLVGASVSSITQNLQQLSVQTDDGGLPSEGHAPSVVIPDHLQVHDADCSHLSFGSFGSGMTVTYSSGTIASVPVNSNLEETHSEPDLPSIGQPETRSSEYYVDDSLRNADDDGLFHKTGTSAGSFDPSSATQPEGLNPENAELAHRNEYSFPSANTGYSYDDSQHLNATFTQTSSHMHNLAPFSNIMQSYTNSLPSTLSPANAHPNRESDLQYSSFSAAQSISTKYGNPDSSIGGSVISTSEALKAAGFSQALLAPQTVAGTSAATGPPLPPHLAVHQYSQPNLPLGPFANMIGYPFLPQSYAYMPSAFQQTFAGNSAYHQSLAAVLPQYKNSVSPNSLPQSAAVPSGYGAGFGSSTAISGNFQMNPPAAPSGTTLSYDDVLTSQYKDNNQLISLLQNENSAMWLHGPNSRTMSAVPTNTYYNYQGQNQQTGGGFRQAQQPPQNYGALGYPNFYHSQSGISPEQQQNPRDVSLGGSQGQPKQPQIWQNGY